MTAPLTDAELAAIEAGITRIVQKHGGNTMWSDMERLIAELRSTRAALRNIAAVAEEMGRVNQFMRGRMQRAWTVVSACARAALPKEPLA